MHPNRTLCGLALSCLALGCGSTLRSTARVPDEPPDDDPGPPITVAGEHAYDDALAAHDAARTAGWSADGCASARAAWDEAATELPGLAPPVYMAGVAADACGDHETALERYGAALGIDETLCGARVALGIESHRAGRDDEARAAFERAVEDDTRCLEGYVNLAVVERESENDRDEALANLRRALAIDSRYLPALHQMAELYLAEATRRSERDAPSIAGGVPAVSSTDLEAGDDGRASGDELLSLAEVVCRQAQLIDPGYAPLYNTWGLVNVRQGDIVGALAKFDRARTLDPSMFEAHMNFGELTLGFRGYQDAEGAFARATELRPSSYDAWIGLGAARRGLGRLVEAREAYEHALGLEPERPDAYFDLAVLDQDFGDRSEEALARATARYDEFVTRAADRPGYAAIVEAVTRTCEPEPPSGEDVPGARGVSLRRAHRRWARADCRPGRLQQITNELATRAFMAELAASTP